MPDAQRREALERYQRAQEKAADDGNLIPGSIQPDPTPVPEADESPTLEQLQSDLNELAQRVTELEEQAHTHDDDDIVPVVIEEPPPEVVEPAPPVVEPVLIEPVVGDDPTQGQGPDVAADPQPEPEPEPEA